MVESMIGKAGLSAVTSAGIYLHIPWCRAICSYCDFDRQAHGFELIPAYIDALVSEIGLQPRLKVHSIFFGGGTPSLLEPAQVRRVLDTCGDHFRLVDGAEVTVEMNPGDLVRERVAAYLSAGVNRFSMGVQSFEDRLLRLLGRRHDAEQAARAFEEARAGGAENLSLDLMYGLPGQSLAEWRETLERAFALGPEHLSAYLLTIDERVPLGRQVARGMVHLPVDDLVAEQYVLARELLAANGYQQYEISNWALPGRESRHNLTYWRDEPYLGLGAGAASSYAGRRYKNTPDPGTYIRSVAKRAPRLIEEEVCDWQTALLDHLALGLRLREGLDLGRARERFGVDLLELTAPDSVELRQRGVLECERERVRIAADRQLVSNEIILRLQAALAERLAREPTPLAS
jgi:oxygen-independent coproporphyrinogen-3 oxidase